MNSLIATLATAATAPLSATGSLPAAAARSTTGRDAVAALDSTSLLQGGKAVAIVHNGAVYRLQATRLGKLILTK